MSKPEFIEIGHSSFDVGYLAVSSDIKQGFGEGSVGFSSEFLSVEKTKQIHILKDWIDIMKSQLESTKDELISELMAKKKR